MARTILWVILICLTGVPAATIHGQTANPLRSSRVPNAVVPTRNIQVPSEQIPARDSTPVYDSVRSSSESTQKINPVVRTGYYSPDREPVARRESFDFTDKLKNRSDELRVPSRVTVSSEEAGNDLPGEAPILDLESEVMPETGKPESREKVKSGRKASQRKARLMTYVQSVAINTGIVLALAFGFIWVAKLKMGKQKIVETEVEPETKMGLEASLKLDSKTTIHLVKAGENRVLLACNNSEVQAMVALPAPFNQFVVDEEEAEDTPIADPQESFSVEDFLKSFQSSVAK